ncbi:MAG: NAD(P)-dependent oxidoreductase [Elusimicrobiota bacterium]
MVNKTVKTAGKKAVVFGGSGFLGSNVANELIDRGFKVTIFDITAPDNVKGDFKFIKSDILDRPAVEKAVSGNNFVYNFSGIASLDDASTKPLDTVKLNVIGNLNIIEACVKSKIKRYIYASTIYVYSQKGGFYRCSKQASEIYIEEYHRRNNLDFTVLRYGTLYGPNANEFNSIYRYLKQALEKDMLVLDGTGEEFREYIHVRDAARLSVDILDNQYRNKHIIITGHYQMKFADMVKMIKEILGKNIKVEFTGKLNEDHYSITPYSFIPKIGHKLVSNYYTDMGQGLLECLHEMTRKSHKKHG